MAYAGKSLNLITALIALFCFIAPGYTSAQIGGKTAADGPFMLEDAEDLDLIADGVMRPWLPDYVPNTTTPLQAVSLASPGLTLQPDQTPVGALRFTMKPFSKYINYSFGVPMPSVAGAKTDTFPGDISSFDTISFYAQISASLPNQSQEVILTSYPDPAFPTVHWKFSLTTGTTFQHITLNLRSPDFILNAGDSPNIEVLLANARFLSIYFFGGPTTVTSVTAHIDDIKLVGNSKVNNWTLY